MLSYVEPCLCLIWIITRPDIEMLQFLIGYLQDLVYEVDAWIFQTLIEYLEGWPYLSVSLEAGSSIGQ